MKTVIAKKTEKNRYLWVGICQLEKEDFYTELEKIKTIPGRRFLSTVKKWSIPYTIENLLMLSEWGYDLPTELFEQVVTYYGDKKNNEKHRVGFETDKIFRKYPLLRDYQRYAMQWINDNGGSAIVADPMGLGKTCETISYVKEINSLPVLVVCPASIKLNWQKEIMLWHRCFEKDIVLLSGRTPYKIPDNKKWVIINYDILSDWQETLLNYKFQVIIGDESQYIANHKAQRSKAFINLGRRIGKKLLLTGTPIRNKPAEFFNVLNLVAPKEFPKRYLYLHRYCQPIKTYWGWTFNGATNIDELAERIKPYLLRREKSEVLKELPAKNKQIIFLPTDEDKSFKDYLHKQNEVKSWIKKLNKKPSAADKQKHFQELKWMAYDLKKKFVMNWVRNFLDSGEKLVLFCWHQKVIEDMYNKFEGQAVKVYGKTSQADRQEAVDKFNKDDTCKLFVGQIISAGVGINLHHACSSVAFVEFAWSPADHEQAEDRVHRLGQKDNVNAYYLVANGTVDMVLADKIISKNEIIKQVVDSKKGAEFFGDSISDILFDHYLK